MQGKPAVFEVLHTSELKKNASQNLGVTQAAMNSEVNLTLSLASWVTLSQPFYSVSPPVLSDLQGLAHSAPMTAVG